MSIPHSSLHQPFYPLFVLGVQLEKDSRVSVKLYDMMGKQVSTMVHNQ